MRKALGVGVLVLGVLGLSIWGRADHAARMETGLTEAAQRVLSETVHPVTAEVSGRDITLVGLADTQAEQERVIAAMNDLRGRRVVNADGLRVLPKAAPYLTRFEKDSAGALSGTGSVPSEHARAGLGDVAENLNLASGASPDWAKKVSAGLAALGPMDQGMMELEDTRLTVSGTVQGPEERDAVLAALAGLNEAVWAADIEMLDDGSPPAFSFRWSASDAGTLSGKLPVGFSVDAIAARLSAGDITADDVTVARQGAPGSMALWDRVAALLPEAETVSVQVEDTTTSVQVGLPLGVSTGPAAERLSQLFGAPVEVSTVTPDAPDGTERRHVLTGARERLSGGFWLAIPDITPSVAACATAVDDILSNMTINFLSASAELDDEAIFVLNRLGAFIRECTAEGGLSAEIGGHTDSTGSAALNLRLSAERAQAVRNALIARGAAADRLSAEGFGDTQPIADNETEEGRALNRRTTIVWSE